MTSPTPITLSPPGSREIIDEEKAKSMISGWREQLISHREANASANANGNNLVLCDKIILSDKSYTSAAASLISKFLTSTDEFQPSIASGITIADLKDIIAGRMEDEGLDVLNTISNAFQQSRLVDVDLSDNAMGSKGVTQCATILGGETVSDSLQRLSLCNNGLSRYSMDEVADLLANPNEDKCIAQNLTKLHFFNNMSGNQGCVAFEQIMAKCTDKLEDVRFSGTRARSEGSAHIASALSSLAQKGCLENIVRLDLADNTFSECSEDVANALKSCSKLQYLNLHDCMLSDNGIEEVCDALLESKAPLTFLDLSGNEITASGAKIIAKLVKSLDNIVEFAAEENELTSYGIRRIAKAFNSTTVEKIILNQNECGIIGADALIEMADKVPNLKGIQLDYNMFPEDMVERLTDTFGDKLTEMEDNDDEEDADADLVEEEEEEEEVVEADGEVDSLAATFGKISV